jgi:hypothetical protein
MPQGSTPQRSTPQRSIAPVVGTVVGVALMAVGVWRAVAERHDTHPSELARWVVAADLVHDLLVAPVVVAVGWLVGRVLPRTVRAPVRWALATTAVLCLVAWPYVRGYGRNPTIPSLLDRNYAVGLGVYVGSVWVVAAAWATVAALRARARRGAG